MSLVGRGDRPQPVVLVREHHPGGIDLQQLDDAAAQQMQEVAELFAVDQRLGQLHEGGRQPCLARHITAPRPPLIRRERTQCRRGRGKTRWRYRRSRSRLWAGEGAAGTGLNLAQRLGTTASWC